MALTPTCRRTLIYKLVYMLNPAQLNGFKRDGFVVLKGFSPADHLVGIGVAVDRLAVPPPRIGWTMAGRRDRTIAAVNGSVPAGFDSHQSAPNLTSHARYDLLLTLIASARAVAAPDILPANAQLLRSTPSV